MKNKIIYPKEVPEYIGLKLEDGEYKFIFPCNYQKAITEDELRKDILNILTVVVKYKMLKNINNVHKEKYSFPFNAYIWLIKDYIENGYYRTNKLDYKKNNRGKINWSKTIKNNSLFPNEDNIFYKDFVVKKNQINVENILTMIHKFCVFEAVSKLGWLYNINLNMLEKPNLYFMKREDMLLFLKNKYISAFRDREKSLLLNMIRMLEGLDFNKLDFKNFDLSTNEFEYVFERLIDEKFGNTDSSNYNPYAIWHIDGKDSFETHELRPDTVLIKDNVAYIIDAKYYKYGYTNKLRDLPGVSSVHKQITYTEDLEIKCPSIDKIYNIFFLPASLDDYYIEYIGNVDTSWKDGTKSYERVYTFLIDLKKLLNNNYTRDETIDIFRYELNKVLLREQNIRIG